MALDWDFTVPVPAPPTTEPDPDPGHPLDNFRAMPAAGDVLMTYCLCCLEPMSVAEAISHDCGLPLPKPGRL